MKRPPSIPATRSPLWRREIACGSNPAGALLKAIQESPVDNGVWDLAVRHDDGCACTNGRSMSACTCELVQLEARRLR